MHQIDNIHYIHLRCHSEFSITDGIVRISDYIERAKSINMPALALTDLSNVFGAVKFYKAATEAGIKPIIGCDVWLENEVSRDQPYRLLILCQNEQGFLNLSELLSKAYLENQYRDRVEVKKIMASNRKYLRINPSFWCNLRRIGAAYYSREARPSSCLVEALEGNIWRPILFGNPKAWERKF